LSATADPCCNTVTQQAIRFSRLIVNFTSPPSLSAPNGSFLADRDNSSTHATGCVFVCLVISCHAPKRIELVFLRGRYNRELLCVMGPRLAHGKRYISCAGTEEMFWLACQRNLLSV